MWLIKEYNIDVVPQALAGAITPQQASGWVQKARPCNQVGSAFLASEYYM